jgi:hypothetical protein
MVKIMEMIRCSSCRGAKQVPKLGGMFGECNTCKGSGKIKGCDKPVMVIPEAVEPVGDIVKQVANCVEPSIDTPAATVTKVDPKRALYRKKKA